MTEVPRTEPRVADGAVVPWFVRLMQASPLSPLWTAVCIGASLTLAEFGAAAFSSGALPIDALFVSRALSFSLVIAYVFWASDFLTSGALRDLGDLRPTLRGGDEAYDRIVRWISHLPPGAMVLSAVLGFGFATGMTEIYSGRLGRVFGTGDFDATDAFLLVNILLLWTVGGPALYAGFAVTLRFGRIGERHVAVDLLDLRLLQPFARFGLQMALVVLGALALFLATQALRGFSYASALPYTWFVLYLSPMLALAVLALVVPSRGIHRQIRAAKRAEIQRVQDVIAGNRGALADSPLAREDRALSVVDLVTWRNTVAQIREWPFDAAALGRFGLYLLIPVVSWVGGALVERFVNAVLD